MQITTELLDSLTYVEETLKDLNDKVCWDCRAYNKETKTKIGVYIMRSKLDTSGWSAVTLCPEHANDIENITLIALSEKDIFYLLCR